MTDALALVRWALLVCGLAYACTESAPLAPARVAVVRAARALLPRLAAALVETFVYCPSCVGFWCALGLGVAGLWPLGLEPHRGLAAVESAFASLAVTSVWARLIERAAYLAELPALHSEQFKATTTTTDEDNDDAPQAPP